MLLNSIRWFSLVLLIFAACGVYRLAAEGPNVSLPDLRGTPLRIAPRYDIPAVVTDEQLRQVLGRMRPPSGPAHTNHYVHALRLWGATAEFQDASIPSGHALRQFFLDDRTFQERSGPHTPALMIHDEEGIHPREWKETDSHRNTAAVHTDDLLATLAESGTPLETPLQLRNESATVRDLLSYSLGNYQARQQEYEWTAISYARYVFPATSWTNRYGQRIHVEDLIEQLIDHPLEQGVCGGTHRLEALVVLYRANEQYPVLSSRAKRRILEHLTQVSRLLIESQHADGHWSRTWFRGASSRTEKDRYAEDQMLLTGHHLEWLALAPQQVQPPRETIVRASQWLIKTISETEQATLMKRYGPLSHAARALCLWRGKEAGEIWQANGVQNGVPSDE